MILGRKQRLPVRLLAILMPRRSPTTAIRQIEGTYERGYNNKHEWKLVITPAGGRLKVDRFIGVRDFADHIVAFNPVVTITGIWPMEPP